MVVNTVPGYGVNHGTLEQFEQFCNRNIKVGDPLRPMVLEWFQRRALEDYFNGTAETVILLPKGNGKSTLLAALGLYHLAIVPDGDVKIVASGRPAAEQIFEFAWRMIVNSPKLKRLFHVVRSHREIHRIGQTGSLKACPAELGSIDGKAPTLVLADELHHWSKVEVYAFLSGGLHKRGGRIVGITTAGADQTSFLGIMRAAALRHTITQRGSYTYALTPDLRFALHEFALEPGAAYDDMEAVKDANPLSTITVAELQRMYDSPSTVPALWRRLHCNQWVQDQDALIDELEWGAGTRPECEIPDGCPVFIGCDFGWKRDTTALVPVGILSASPLVVRIDRRTQIVYPPPGGESTKVSAIQAELVRMLERWPEAIVVLDPNAGGTLIAQYLSDELGCLVVEQQQDPSPMAHAAGLVSELVRDGRLEHPAIDELTRQVVNAPGLTVGVGGDRMRFGKHRNVPNDAAVALGLAVRQAHVHEEDRPVLPAFLN